VKSESIVSPAFLVALIVALVVPVAIGFDARSAPLFALSVLVWNLIPVAIALVIYARGKHGAAWGWLVAIAVFASAVWISVAFLERGSTGAIAFLWIPVWSCLVVGPVGAFVGYLLGRLFRRQLGSSSGN
jgi:hypothetical protein